MPVPAAPMATALIRLRVASRHRAAIETISADDDSAFATPEERMARWLPTNGSRPGTAHNVPHVIERRPWNRNGYHQPRGDATANGTFSATTVIPAPETSGTAAFQPLSCTRRAMSGGRNAAGNTLAHAPMAISEPLKRSRPSSNASTPATAGTI